MNLQEACLGTLPLTPEQVQLYWDDRDVKHSLRSIVRTLCLSHERLRAELAGINTMLLETEVEMKRLRSRGDI